MEMYFEHRMLPITLDESDEEEETLINAIVDPSPPTSHTPLLVRPRGANTPIPTIISICEIQFSTFTVVTFELTGVVGTMPRLYIYPYA